MIEQLLLLLERSPDRTAEGYVARVVVFDVDPETGAKSVRDICEAATAWYALRIAMSGVIIATGTKLGVERQDGTVVDLTSLMDYKTEDARLGNILKALEAVYRTGLDIKKPRRGT